MLSRLWRLNLTLALIASLGITLPSLGAMFQIPALKEIPSPLHALSNLPTPSELIAEGRAWILPEQKERARVIRGIDGDTILVRVGGERVRVRMIGVDTSESVKRGVPVQCYAKEASHATAKHLAGKKVTLVYDVERKDKYGRTLAYVIKKGRDFNAWLLRQGYARTLEIAPNTARARKYRGLETKAKKKGRGVWTACKGELSWVE